MFKNISIGVALFVSMAFVAPSFAADPSMHEIYQAAEAGKMDEAQAMMDKVLHDHPNSAKAHFVESELLAKQGRLANAETELKTAERLAPGLPFAQAQAVQHLKSRIATAHQPAYAPAAIDMQSGAAAATAGIPWTMILLGVGILFAIFYFVRSATRNNVSGTQMSGNGGYAPAGSTQSYGASPMQSFGNNPIGPQMGSTGGMGSGIMGSLATGAALGAGIVAGEALVHHFTDGNRHDVNPAQPLQAIDNNIPSAPYDMGGSDFGVADNASWDDSAVSGNDDWDS